MTRTIKASEVKPGMEIEFSLPRKMTIHKNVEGDYSKRELEDVSGIIVFVDADTPVTVLAEAQPEEPTTFGARVVVNGRRFLRVLVGRPWSWLEADEGTWWSWDDLCEMGHVQVIPDPGWKVPADVESIPGVPDRIEKWPEDDTALRAHKWRGRLGNTWTWSWTGPESRWEGRTSAGNYVGAYSHPTDDPFTRVTDA